MSKLVRTESRSRSHLSAFVEQCVAVVVAVGVAVAVGVVEEQSRRLHRRRMTRKVPRLLLQTHLHPPLLWLQVHEPYTLYYRHASCIFDPLMTIVLALPGPWSLFKRSCPQ